MFEKPGFRLGLLISILICSVNAADHPSSVKSFVINSPPSFGYSIGDLITRKIAISVSKPFVLTQSQLPTKGPINGWLELRNIGLIKKSEIDQTNYLIEVEYQLFKQVKKTETLTIPGWKLQFTSSKASQKLFIPPWEFSYGPLIPSGTADNRVDIRAASEPEPRSISRPLTILIGSLTGLLGVLTYFALRNAWFPLFGRNLKPFASAYDKIKKLNRSKNLDSNSFYVALRTFHQAIDETAGKAVFVNQLDWFFMKHPAFKQLRKDTQGFFDISRSVFFSVEDKSDRIDYPISRILDLCRQYRAAER